MAIRVPVKQEQVNVRSAAGAVSEPNLSAPPAAAFGGNIAEADLQMGETLAKVGEVVAGHALKQQQLKTERYVIDSLEQFKRESQNLLDNPEIQDIRDNAGNITGQRPAGFLQRMLSNADGATKEFDQASQGLLGRYMDGFKSHPLIADAFYKSAASYVSAQRDNVIGHEAKQLRASYTNSQMKSISNLIEEASAQSGPDSEKNVSNLNRVIFGPGGLKERVTQLNEFEGKSGSEAEASLRKWISETVDRSATNATIRHGVAAGRAQLNAFAEHIGTEAFNNLDKKLMATENRIEKEVRATERIRRQMVSHELIDLKNNGLLTAATLEEKFLTKQISNSLYKELQDSELHDVGKTADTDAQTYYDLTHYLLQDDVDPEKAVLKILQANNAGKLSNADMKKIYEMNLIGDDGAFKSLGDALASGGFEQTKEAFDNHVQSVTEKKHWLKAATGMLDRFFNGPDKEPSAAMAMRKVLEISKSEKLKAHEIPLAVEKVMAMERLKRHPEWAKFPKEGKAGTRRGRPVRVYPDGRIEELS